MAAASARIVGKERATCDPAPKCDKNTCLLPDCFCSGNETTIEGGKPDRSDKPQLVFLTFDDALSKLAADDFYEELFGTPTGGKHKNPNGCGIRATHFITHSYTDYSLVNKYWHYGHEIASHSITHRNDLDYWKGLDEQGWADEIVGMRRIASQFSAIDPCEIKGMRSPFLQGGGDAMYSMLENNKFEYDCTWPTRTYGFVDAEIGLYPYTLDYASIQDCPIKPCPSCAHPGLWVQPMIDLEDEWIGANPQTPDQGNPCSMLDACTIIPHDDFVEEDVNQVFHMLMKNFNRTYNGDVDWDGQFNSGNRAPWGLYMHAAWFFGGNHWHYEGYKMFIEEIATYDDVWIVPVQTGIDYMKFVDEQYNYSNEDMIAFGKDKGPFACKDIEEEQGKYNRADHRCGPPKSCKFPGINLPDDNILNQERYMTICSYKPDGTRQNCPDENQYPWLEGVGGRPNPCGGNVPCDDCKKA